ncbi:MAG: hypothetical protein LBE38_12460 [Deltaproteobacteria bacterium]|jgi:transposase|nr:hypothetical protein [Deltaproteobacteria bacterium]
MSSFVSRLINGTTYIYESTAFRNAEGKPDNHKTSIGKIDRETGKICLNQKYLNYLSSKKINIMEQIVLLEKKFEIPIEKSILRDTFHVNDKLQYDHNILYKVETEPVESSNIQFQQENYEEFEKNMQECVSINFGSSYLLEQLSKQIGLYQIVKEVFYPHANAILSIIFYLVSKGEPVYYCEDWIADNLENISPYKLNYLDISILLQNISEEKKSSFFKKWIDLRDEQEYLALDIASISSFSEFIGDVEYGKNKENDLLPQTNLCLFFGKTSGVPIYFTQYSGSINDVVTLKSTIEQLHFLNNRNCKIVMDKSFYSTENINFLLENFEGYPFLIAAPLRNKYIHLFETLASDISHDKYRILCERKMVLGKRVRYKWNDNNYLYMYFYFNQKTFSEKKDDLYQYLLLIRDEIIHDIDVYKKQKDKQKYFLIKRKKNFDSTGEYIVQLNHFVIAEMLNTTGKMILIGNDKDLSIETALEICRSKDIVEKGFLRFQSSLDLKRIRMHSSKSMCNKDFICFLAQILMSYLDTKMSSTGLYHKMPLHKLIKKFQSCKLKKIAGKRVLNPLSKFQKDTLNSFGIDCPDKNYELLK